MKRRGFSLIEMLVVLSALAMLMGLSYTMFLGVIRADRVGVETLQRISRRAEVADQFRADVHATVELPADLGEFRAGPTCLILKHGDAAWVIYQVEPNQLIRIEKTGDAQTSTPIKLTTDEATAGFSQVDGVVRLRIVEPTKYGRDKVTVIDAAKGGRR